ncbi:MAG: 2'-5' RNA ligase family protein [Bacteroidota bacterium]
MSQMPKYSLWLVPEKDTFKQFKGIIEKLSFEHRSPMFLPHITLLGTLPGDMDELSKKMERLAMTTGPIEVSSLELQYHDTYFRSLFLRIDPVEALVELQETASDVFGVEQDAIFFPHLSLMYGATQQEDIINELDEDELTILFECDALQLVQTNGPVTIWEPVAEIRLG